MGATFALRGEQTQSCGRIWGYLSAFPSRSWRVTASIHNCGRSMDTPLHSRVKGTVKTVSFWRRTDSKESENGEIGRHGDGHGFLRCMQNHLYRLLEKRTKDNWSVLCIVIVPLERRNQEKTFSFEKEKDPFLSRQSTGTHLRSLGDQNYGIKIRIITTSTGFGPQWLIFISKLEKMVRCIKLKGDYVKKYKIFVFYLFHLFPSAYWTILVVKSYFRNLEGLREFSLTSNGKHYTGLQNMRLWLL